MAERCPRCNTPVRGDAARCMECGTELIPDRAPRAPGGRSKAKAAARVADQTPARPKAGRSEAARPAREPAEAPPSPAAPKEPVAEAPAPPPTPAPQPAPSRAEPTRAPEADAPRVVVPEATARPTRAGSGTVEGLRRWLAKRLGVTQWPEVADASEPGPEPEPEPAAEPPGMTGVVLLNPALRRAPDVVPHGFHPPGPWTSPLADISELEPPEPPPEPLTVPTLDRPEPIGEHPPAERVEVRGPIAPPPGLRGIPLKLQVLDPAGQWRDWGPIDARGLTVGRAQPGSDLPPHGQLAARHARFRDDGGTLWVEDLGSLNGTYRRITRPVALADGVRFRIGGHTLEFREAAPALPVTPAVSADGEPFCGRDLAALAFVDLVRPDGTPGLRFPITKPDATVIGREGPGADIALADDHSINTTHAQLRREGDRFVLEDLKSRNGTFVQVLGPSPIEPGDLVLAGRALFRAVEAPRPSPAP